MPSMLPPDGEPWPPRPSTGAAADPEAAVADLPAAPDSAPEGSEFADWRSMGRADQPEGYSVSGVSTHHVEATVAPAVWGSVAVTVAAWISWLLFGDSGEVLGPLLAALGAGLGFSARRTAKIDPRYGAGVPLATASIAASIGLVVVVAAKVISAIE